MPSLPETLPTSRVLLVDSGSAQAHRLVQSIARDPAFVLLGAAVGIRAVVGALQHTVPDLVVVDLEAEDESPTVVRAVVAACPQARVLVVAERIDRTRLIELLQAGAAGCLLRQTPWAELRLALIAAAGGHVAVSRGVLDHVVGDVAPAAPVPEPAHLPGARALVQRVIDERRLHIEWQPVVDLVDGGIGSAEALSRFDDDAFAGPAEWFAAAEATGLTVELEVVAAELAVEAAGSMPDGARLAINVSPATILTPAFAAAVAPILSRLTLEITEQAPVEDYAALAADLVGWRARGALLSIDDTGAGFASFRHIIELIPDQIKLDRSLTCRVHHDHRRRALIAALVAFAREVGAQVVAEGIETATELEALRALGVRWGQGWLLGRPQPLTPGDFTVPVAFPRVLDDDPDVPGRRPVRLVEFLDRPMGLGAAAEHVAQVVSSAIEDAAVHVGIFDRPRGCWRVVAAAGPGALCAGHAIPLNQSPCWLVAEGTLPDVCAGTADDPQAAGLGLVRATAALSYATVVTDLVPGEPGVSLIALSREPGAFEPHDHDVLSAGARVLVAAVRRETSSCGDEGGVDRLRAVATLDPVSGTLNRGAWQAAYEEAGMRLSQAPGPSALVVVRVDGLEAVRREHGAAKADLLLKACAKLVTARVRDTDVVGEMEPGVFGALLVGYAREETVEPICRAIEAGARLLSETQHVVFGVHARATPVAPRDWRRALAEVLAPA